MMVMGEVAYELAGLARRTSKECGFVTKTAT